MIPNQWYAILPSKTVRKGQVVAVKRLGLDLALFRDNSGNIACVTDHCSHRGAALSVGKVKGDCLQCPFHGLEFDTQGRCRFIPANGKASTEDIGRYNVKSYRVREGHGIIYLWFGGADVATDTLASPADVATDTLASPADVATDTLPFPADDIDDTFVYSEMEDHWNSHYSRCIENQLDVVHLPFVHGNTIGRGDKTLVNGPKVEFVPGGLITSANNDVDTGQKPRRAAECQIKETYLEFRFPNLWMNHIMDKMRIVIFFAPVDDENTILYIRFYTKITGLRPVDWLIAQIGRWGNLIVERQDKRVVITQTPKASSYLSGEKLLAGDGPIIQYRRIRNDLQNGR